ncbi:hypothetical protein [Pseudomonas sp. BN102]|uniref:hypothetical protein n=1 Tax=Pseudomonas sp. BN102 TaxID=2567886 RepID=UPI0024561660|nr:hypothetical protein [Pseudomonas sp. BN102]MDH4611359.1 hypothetical protein [Pseudomonas sp. BN102]
MTTRNTSGQREYICAHCGTDYLGKKHIDDKSQRFCTPDCKQKKHRAVKAAEKAKKKVDDRFDRFPKSARGIYVIGKCRDAGTVQIMQGHTTASLLRLHDLHDRFYKCHGWNPDEKKSVFNICHVQSHKGRDGSRGLLHPDNLFIGCSSLNRQQHNKPVPADAGLSIPASKLQRKWAVSSNDSDAAIAKKIRAFLGAKFDNYLDQAKSIDLNKRHALAQRIYNRQQKGTEVNKLDRRYTLGELEALEYEVLEAMDAYQSGKDVANKFKPEVYTRALLCIYAEELERFASGTGRHADNCRFMLPLVRFLGMYIAQIEDMLDRRHGSFLRLPNAEWKPIQRNSGLYWGTAPHSVMAYDFAYMKETILQGAFDALQGLKINKARYEDHIHKRLNLNTLVPTVDVPDHQSWEANSKDWGTYVDHLYASFTPVWQALLDLGLCTADQIEDARLGVLWSLQAAIEEGRHQHRNDHRWRRNNCKWWGFKDYPQWLEFPAVLAEKLLHPSMLLPCDDVDDFAPAPKLVFAPVSDDYLPPWAEAA